MSAGDGLSQNQTERHGRDPGRCGQASMLYNSSAGKAAFSKGSAKGWGGALTSETDQEERHVYREQHEVITTKPHTL